MKERNSNFELLRLFSMFSIVFYHLLVFRINDLSGDYWLYQALTIIFHFGVIVFVLISGWFGIKLTWKRVYNIYIPCVLYAFLLYLIFADTFEIKKLSVIFLPFSSQNPLWFIPPYFYLCLISPLMNKLLDNSSINDYLKYISILSIFEFYFGFIRNCEVTYEGRTLISFIFLYVLGKFCRIIMERNPDKDRRNKIIRKNASLILFLIISSILLGKLSGIKLFSMYAGAFFAYNSPGLILIAILILLIFSTFKIQSKKINFIASSSFAIYLIGSNPYVSKYIYVIAEQVYGISTIILQQIFLLLIYSVAICAGCLLIDMVINNLIIKRIVVFASRISQLVNPYFFIIQKQICKIIH